MAALMRMQPAQPFAKLADDGYQPPSYAEKLFKLIPAEAVSVYMTGRTLITATFEDGGSDPLLSQTGAWAVLTMFSAAILILVRAQLTSDSENDVTPEWPAIRVSFAAFILWVYAFGDIFTQAGNMHSPLLAALLLLVGNFILPALYRPKL